MSAMSIIGVRILAIVGYRPMIERCVCEMERRAGVTWVKRVEA